MKSSLIKKGIIVTVISVLLIGTGVAATLAYLSDKEKTLVNVFTVGNVTTEIEEIFEQGETAASFKKEPVVVNTGENDCFVRARVLASPKDALTLAGYSSNWTLKDDGFYYYKEILPSGGRTDSIFKTVEVTDISIDGFEVMVYQEAVQTIVYAEDGSFTTDAETIWQCYDSGTVPASFN